MFSMWVSTALLKKFLTLKFETNSLTKVKGYTSRVWVSKVPQRRSRRVCVSTRKPPLFSLPKFCSAEVRDMRIAAA